ncbi:AraC family transcriptional regulator [Sphingomonas sp. SFZ2018-12]|uniref:AraC family transcriptional regulator n=1 Tax=Sphingomonas sp. SFZ2018-12 TaxID=2683197 RepID=UPI001F0ED81B|nr:AraC family transcriptional regulator [Sphingomonas sp. SFZ2018-12]
MHGANPVLNHRIWRYYLDMIIGQLDLVLRIGSLSILFLLAWLLFGQKRRVGLPALLFAPLAVCLAGFLLGNTPLVSFQPAGLVGNLASAASGFTVIFLWWFALSCFDSRFRLQGGVLMVGLAWAGIAAAGRGLLGNRLADAGLSHALVMMGFGIVAHLVWRLLDERQGDLIEQRYNARVLVAVLLGGMLFIDLAADVLFGFDWRPLAFSMAQNAMILGFGVWLAGRVLTVRGDALFFGVVEARAVAPEPIPDGTSDRTDPLHARLCTLIEDNRVHLDPELTFPKFVELMAAPERAVRTLINQQLSHDHFRAFLNTHRILEARRLLQERDRNEKLITIALDSGFASLASFNRAFRAIVGCTPSEYRAAALHNAGTALSSPEAGF